MLTDWPAHGANVGFPLTNQHCDSFKGHIVPPSEGLCKPGHLGLLEGDADESDGQAQTRRQRSHSDRGRSGRTVFKCNHKFPNFFVIVLDLRPNIRKLHLIRTLDTKL